MKKCAACNLSATHPPLAAVAHLALLLDKNGVILVANHTVSLHLEKPIEQLIGANISELMAPAVLQEWQDRLRRITATAGGETLHFFERIKGREYEVSLHPLLYAAGRLSEVAVFGSDITERRRAEEALQRADRDGKTIFQAIGHPTMVLDPQHRILQVNHAVCRLFGKSEPELIGRRCFELYRFPGGKKGLNECLLQQRLGAGIREPVEMEMAAQEGIFIVSCTPVCDDSGRLQKIIHVATDITERKRTEVTLEEERAFLRQVIDTVPSIISVRDAEGRFELANKFLANACLTTPEQLIGKTIADFNPNRKDVCQVTAENAEVIASRKDKFIAEAKVNFPNPAVQWVSAYKTPLLDRDGGCTRVLSVALDITERKRAEEKNQKLQQQLNNMQKLEAVGALAGGIAHDFNNILMGLQGHISMLLYDLNLDHPHRMKLENMESYIKRGADLTRQLLGFARGGKYDVKPTDMNELLGKSAELFGRTRKEIFVYRNFAEGLWTVDVDQGQMDQVLLNLFINASQAMPGGGNLDLRTENIDFAESDVKPIGVGNGRYVKISVTDDGMGMDQKTLERVFEPFFTTKPKGIGSGLGLASAYGIVKNHGGGIHLYSTPGKGTTVQIHLPASEEKPSVVGEHEKEEEILTGHETILVVDDEEINVAVMVEMLEMLHYRVLPAGSGQEAVAIYMEKGKEIDLVILDMIMPGIGGGRTFDILREIDPAVDVILASGYSADSGARTIIDRGCRGFIQKPFQLQELSRKIREVLDQKQ